MNNTLELPPVLQEQVDHELFKIRFNTLHNNYMNIIGLTGNHPKAIQELRVSNFKKAV